MDKSTQPKEKYDVGKILFIHAELPIAGGTNMLLAVSIQIIASTVNVSLKSRVWENYKHGSVGGAYGE